MAIPKNDVHEFVPRLILRRHTGLLIGWHQQKLRYHGPIDQMERKTKDINVYNGLVGWWSLFSLIINPIIIIWNIRNLQRYKREYSEFSLSPKAYIMKAKLSTKR